MTHSPKSLLILAPLTLSWFVSGLHGQDRPASPSMDVKRLIQLLGADSFRERDAAQKTLATRDEAIPALFRALPTLNAEALSRAKLLLASFAQRRTKLFLQYAREGRADLFAEWFAISEKPIDDAECWQGVLDIGWRVLERSRSAEELSSWAKPFPPRTFEEFLRRKPRIVDGDNVIAGVDSRKNLGIRSLDNVRTKGIESSVLIGTGSAAFDSADKCILVVVGDIKISRAADCLIIADGNVRLGGARNCVLAVRGMPSIDVDLDRPPTREARRFNNLPRGHLLLLPKAEPPPPGPPKIINPLMHRLQFFELADIGLELTEAGWRLRVASLRPGCTLATAGLRTNDVLISIDGSDIRVPNVARRLLRRSFVLGGGEITVERAGKRITIDVDFLNCELSLVNTAK